ADIVEDPVAKAARTGGKPHAGIVAPVAVLPGRVNAAALSFSHSQEFDAAVAELRANRVSAQAIVAGVKELDSDATRLVYNASDMTEHVGSVSDTKPVAVAGVLSAASAAAMKWNRMPASSRALILELMANEIQRNSARLGALLVMENGATLSEAA